MLGDLVMMLVVAKRVKVGAYDVDDDDHE